MQDEGLAQTKQQNPAVLLQRRLEQFERLLSENSEQTILTLAFQAGFASKATFNAAFKNKHGVSPSVYAKQREPGI